MDLSNKTIIVTGAGAGIGKAITQKLTSYGAKVIAVSLVQSELNDLAKEIPSVRTVQVDLTNWTAVGKALENIGPIQGLVNNAGTGGLSLIGDITEAQIDGFFNLNVKALINVTQIAAKNMIDNGVTGGSIVNIASIAALTSVSGGAVYCATKAAVQSLTSSMALELGKKGIRVNSVNPTFVKTELSRAIWEDKSATEGIVARTPLSRWAEPEEVAEAVAFLLSDKAAFINGIALPVDGGYLTCN